MSGGHQGECGPEYLLVPTSDPALIPVTWEGKEKHILEVRDGTLVLSKFQRDKRSNPDERAKEVTPMKEPISVAYNTGNKGRVDWTHKWLTFLWDEV